VRILIADDDAVTRCALETTLAEWGHTVVAVSDGTTAWDILRGDHPPALAVLDWIMSDPDGLEVCRRVRALNRSDPPYLILLTIKGEHEDVIAGLEGGADDYMSKPFDWRELRARIGVGLRVVRTQQALAERARQLQDSMEQLRVLRGLLPICSYCKRIRNDQDYWQQLEEYVSEHTDARFSHGICPHCYEKELGIPWQPPRVSP
jgi:DNA-binding response OmpR family regulator